MIELLVFLASLINGGQVYVLDVSTRKVFEVQSLRYVDEMVLYIDSSVEQKADKPKQNVRHKGK